MNSILKFFVVYMYMVVLTSIFSFYFTLEDKYENDLLLTQKQLHGIEYLNILYQLRVSVKNYKSYVELDEKTQLVYDEQLKIISNIDMIYDVQNECPPLKNASFNEKMENLKKFKLSDDDYYDLIDFINHEYYRVGDVANLLFERSRKLYFLNTLATHYLPKYLATLLSAYGVIEEVNHKGHVNKEKINRFIEQNKFLELRAEKIFDIIEFLDPYEDAATLKRLISKIRNELKDLPKDAKTLLSSQSNVSNARYINTTDKILEETSKLNANVMDLLELAYLERERELTNKIFYNRLLFVFIFFLISALFVYFRIVFTSKKKQESELRGLALSLNKLIIFSKTNKQGRIVQVSEGFTQLCGYSKDELLSRTHSLLKHENTDPSLYANMWKTIAAKKQWEGELQNVRKDGSSYWVNLKIQPEFDSIGDISGYVAYRIDITRQKELELEKQKTIERMNILIAQNNKTN